MGVVNVTPDSFSDGGVHLRSGGRDCRRAPPAGRGRGDRRRRRRVDAAGGRTRLGRRGAAPRRPRTRGARRAARVDRHSEGGGRTAGARARRRARQRRHRAARRSRAGGRRRGRRRVSLPDAHAGRAADDAARPALRRRRRRRGGIPRGAAGVRGRPRGSTRSRICLDPGFGFGKTPDQNLAAAAGARRARRARPAGARRPLAQVARSAARWAIRRPARVSVDGSVGAAVAAFDRGASIFRVHDVRPHVEALALAAAVERGRRRVTVEVLGIELVGYHGVLEEERRRGQRFLVDVWLEPVGERAAASDEIEDAVDYRDVVALVRRGLGGQGLPPARGARRCDRRPTAWVDCPLRAFGSACASPTSSWRCRWSTRP